MDAATQETRISIYWIPGCSSCLKVKEFVAEKGLTFESVNVAEHPEAMDELAAAGIRGVPAVRNGSAFGYAQSLDDVAALLGIEHSHVRLPQDVLLRRWDRVLQVAEEIAVALHADVLERQVMPHRKRQIRELAFHIFQVAESFLRQIEDDSIDARAIYLDPREDIRTRDDMVSYIGEIRRQFSVAFLQADARTIPSRLNTHYGLQPSGTVLERGVWHSAQHARQLDVVAAGMGAELRIPDELYAGLPMPKRLWS